MEKNMKEKSPEQFGIITDGIRREIAENPTIRLNTGKEICLLYRTFKNGGPEEHVIFCQTTYPGGAIGESGAVGRSFNDALKGIGHYVFILYMKGGEK